MDGAEVGPLVGEHPGEEAQVVVLDEDRRPFDAAASTTAANSSLNSR